MVSGSATLCFAMLIICEVCCTHITDGTKRLLLGDPNQINSQLQLIETRLQSLERMESRVKSLENTISMLTTKQSGMKTTFLNNSVQYKLRIK